MQGYPLQGFILLRDIKDTAIFLSGIAHNITTFPKILGMDDSTEVGLENLGSLRKARMKEEKRVLNKMLRSDSGLPKDVIDELNRWESLFNSEVHGSNFTIALELGPWLRGEERHLHFGPVPNKRSLSMYMNRVVEVGWLVVRLLSYLQPIESVFGPTWNRRQAILDHSFRMAVESLGELGKKIASAFTHFVNAKFWFPEDLHYFEADGSA